MNNALLALAFALAVVFGLSALVACGGSKDEGTPTPKHDDKCARYKKKPHAYDYKDGEAGMNAGCYQVTSSDSEGNMTYLFCCK